MGSLLGRCILTPVNTALHYGLFSFRSKEASQSIKLSLKERLSSDTVFVSNSNNKDNRNNNSVIVITGIEETCILRCGVGEWAVKCSGCTESAAVSMNALRKSGLCRLLPRAPQIQRRLICKSGECNVSRVNIDKRGRRYLADIFTTMVDIKWRWNLLVFTLAFTLSWVFFGFVWWLICYAHGDMIHYGHPEWKPCVADVYDFPTALLFSIETQQTIGYGTRCTSSECPVAVVMMMVQSCFGIIIQALMTGLVFAKISRPKKRAQTLMFSKNAIICQRDDELCFLFRVGDMRKSQLVEAQVRAIMVDKRVTREGEVLALYQRDLLLKDDTEGRLFLVWPVILEHRITPDSPLWELSADDLKNKHFEILVVLEGIVESTGMTTQARTSYLPNEILWGHRFERLVTYQRNNGQYLIDYASFNRTMAVDMSSMSAKDREKGNVKTKNNEGSDNSEDSICRGDQVTCRPVIISDNSTTADADHSLSRCDGDEGDGDERTIGPAGL